SLYHSYFNGTIPATIGNLKNLTLLDLSKNKFFGTIPKSLGSLTNLASLGLDDNELSFTIPTTLSRLTRLSALDLSYNRLSGPIPSVLAHLTNLSRLSVKRNRLAGTIPTSLARLTRLASLDLDVSYNELAGSVPSLHLMNSLWHVGADHNYLTGIAGTSLADIHLLCDKFRLSLGSNCLGSNTVLCGSTQTQKTKYECDSLCWSYLGTPYCSGHGVCYIDHDKIGPQCACYEGYTAGTAAATCIPLSQT
ncbi:unnamed protein product, partial [Closterium sp. NIES-65]